ncbi:MAG: glycosyltransferase family A protein [Pseudomonadota bacterium]
MDVTAIIPTYNRPEFLKDCLQSILEQSRKPAEIIVVDDGSESSTAAVVQGLGADIKLIQNLRNTGKAVSLNLGIEQASKPLVWVVDDDDIALPHAVETLVNLMAKSPSAGFAYGRHMRFLDDGTGSRVEIGTGYWQSCDPADFLTQTLEDLFPHQPGMVVRKSLFQKVGPFNTSLERSQDYEMLIRLARAAACVGTDEILFLQRKHDGTRGSARDRFEIGETIGKWVEYDRRILQSLYLDLDLEEYLPRGEALESVSQSRRALLQRGVIFARKKLWALAIKDFEAASFIGPGNLSEQEKTLLRRTFASKYGCDEIRTDVKIIAGLRELKCLGPAGPAILRSIMRGMRWRIREAFEKRHTRHAIDLAKISLSTSLPKWLTASKRGTRQVSLQSTESMNGSN